MQMAPQMGYDRAITVFSPDGRLFQVEYAREAVKRGTTSVGIKAKDGVALLVDKRISSRLLEPQSTEKIFQVDDHIGAVTSGLVADARALVDRARVDAQINRVVYNEPIALKHSQKKSPTISRRSHSTEGLGPTGQHFSSAGLMTRGHGFLKQIRAAPF